MEKYISVIVPAYNEEGCIEGNIRGLDFWLKKHFINTYEIIIVNDGSTDRTHEIISRLANKNIKIKSYRKNRGKGYAVRTGLLSAKAPVILLLDADMSVRINELDDEIIDEVYNWSQDDLIVKGQRIQVQRQPLFRVFVGKCFKVLTWLMTGIYLDTQCPFQILKLPKSFYHELKIDGFAFDVEILYKAKQKGYFIVPKKVKYFNDENSKVTFLKALLMFKELIELRKK